MALVFKVEIARPAGVHYNHNVSPSVRPLAVSENAHNSSTTWNILIKFRILMHVKIGMRTCFFEEHDFHELVVS